MEIRKLTEADYDQVIELYTQLDEFHVQARPDCFVHREKDKIYPKDAFIHNLSYPDGLDRGEQLFFSLGSKMQVESYIVHHENTVIAIPQLRCFQLYSPYGELYWLRQLYLLRK